MSLLLQDLGFRNPPSAHPTRPGRGEILPVGFSPRIFPFFPQKCCWFRAIAPHAGVLQVRPHKTSLAFLWVVFPHPCFSCHHNSSFWDNCIPGRASLPLISRASHWKLQGDKETNSAKGLKGLFVLPLAEAAVPFPAHFKSPFHFFFFP